MTSLAGQQIITIHSWPVSQEINATRLRFGQSIKDNTENVFLEKSYTKCGGETSPGPFYKKSKLRIQLDHQSEML